MSAGAVGVPGAVHVVRDATCLGCGCLCDDLAVGVEGGQIAWVENACPAGRAWLETGPLASGVAVAAIGGRAAGEAEALERAVEILRAARRPLVTGLGRLTMESQRLAVAVADRIGATVDPGEGEGCARRAAMQRLGSISATLGEVRNRADVVVFWRCDPLRTHPRHLERYSAAPRGEFLPGGRGDRRILVAGDASTETGRAADEVLPVGPGNEAAALGLLRLRVRGLSAPAEALAAAGLDAAALDRWAGLLRGARYGAIFSEPTGDAAREAALVGLVRDLNGVTRCVGLGLGGPGNPAGAEAVLGWQTGYGAAVDLGAGYPQYRPGEATAEARLARGEADAALVLGPVEPLSEAARAHLATIPTVLVAPAASVPWAAATVGLACGVPGIHEGGTVLRVDGVTLPLRLMLPAPQPTAREWLSRLLEGLGPVVEGS